MKNKKMPLNIQLFAEGEPVTQTDDNTEGTGTEPVTKTEGATVKTFTQEEVNAMILKEKKKMPSKEELEEFNQWKESKKTEAEKQTKLTKNNVDLANKNTLLEQKLLVSDSNVPNKYRDFVQFTVSQMDGDFEENLKEYLNNNPQYLQTTEVTNIPKENTGVAVTKNNEKAENGVTAILKEKHPELFN